MPKPLRGICGLTRASGRTGGGRGVPTPPGGDSGDLQATALREFFEETGSSETPIFIGKLSEVYIPVSKFIVQPYVAYLTKRPVFFINDVEVYKLIEWELHELLAQQTTNTTIITASNIDIVTPYFMVDEKILWGATAMIINELKHVIKDSVNL